MSTLFAKTSSGHELPVFDDGRGNQRFLACMTGGPSKLLATTWTGAGKPIFPQSSWVEVDRTRKEVPILDQGQHGSCFPAGTRIRMADGSQKPIQLIKLLDKVLTAEGNIGTVTELMVKRADDGIIILNLWGHSHLRMTPEHPVLTRRGYVSAKDLAKDDWVSLPRYLPNHTDEIRTDSHVQRNRFNMRTCTQRYAGVVGRCEKIVVKTAIPEVIKKNANTGLIFGLFLAEGSTDSSRVVWTFNLNESDTLVNHLVAALQDEWGVEAHIRKIVKKHTVKVVVYGKTWALLFESLCGNGSGKKILHPDMTNGPEIFLTAILNSWLDGDGYERRTTQQGVTVSHDLALNMFDIANALGRRPSIRTSFPKVSHGVQRRQQRWDIEYGTVSDDTYRCELDEKTVWRRVREITKEDFDGLVFNMEVEGDLSLIHI